MRTAPMLLGSLLLVSIPAQAQVLESERAELIDEMTDQQRADFEALPPAVQDRVLQAIIGKRKRAAGRPQPKPQVDVVPPAFRRAIDAAIGVRVREAAAEDPLAGMLEAESRKFSAEDIDTCERYRKAGSYDDELDIFCESLEEQQELEEGKEMLGQICMSYSDEEREAMCANYKRELASVEAGPESADKSADEVLRDRQVEAGALGMGMMMENCGCDEFEAEEP